MSLFFVYRKTSGEIQVQSVTSQIAGWNATYFAEVQDPATPDGIDLAVTKIYDGSNLRNATTQEIANFATLAATDNTLITQGIFSNLLNANVDQGIIYKAVAQVMINEINSIRDWVTSFKAAVAAATSLANLQSRVAALSDLPDRTASQARTAIQSAITSGSNN